MESQKITEPKEKIRTALSSKWSKLTEPELKDIVGDHDKLFGVLKSRYAMSTDDARRESTSFFKPYAKAL